MKIHDFFCSYNFDVCLQRFMIRERKKRNIKRLLREEDEKGKQYSTFYLGNRVNENSWNMKQEGWVLGEHAGNEPDLVAGLQRTEESQSEEGSKLYSRERQRSIVRDKSRVRIKKWDKVIMGSKCGKFQIKQDAESKAGWKKAFTISCWKLPRKWWLHQVADFLKLATLYLLPVDLLVQPH